MFLNQKFAHILYKNLLSRDFSVTVARGNSALYIVTVFKVSALSGGTATCSTICNGAS
jgi:hypothetical protein